MKEKIKTIINKMSFKKLGIMSLALIVLIGFVVIVQKSFSYDAGLLEDVTINNLKITNINIDTNNGITKYTAKVLANESSKVSYIKMDLKDENNEIVVTLIGYIGKTLNQDETFDIEANTDANIDSVKRIEYSVVE